jgi:creatinine amidohydrolase
LAVADDPDRTTGGVFPHRVAHTSNNGVTGRPSAATAGQGRHLLTSMGEALASLIQQARTENPPLAWQAATPFPRP